MNSNLLTLKSEEFPEFLANIPAPPKRLYYSGPLLDLLQSPRLAVVGSRKVTAYGRAVTTKLAGQSAEQGIVIVSGLALGVDALAHQAALEAGGKTIAVLPSDLKSIYPATNRRLAQQILDQGGALVSEYANTPSVRREYFIARNRLISGLSNATLVTEAALKSGSLHTARFTLEQGRSVLSVPGSIFSATSVGTNSLIRAGATPVTSVEDILFALILASKVISKATPKGESPAEDAILQLLGSGEQDGDFLQNHSGLEITVFNQALTMLEITGKIRSLGGNSWVLA
jgi:DNA processing protein